MKIKMIKQTFVKGELAEVGKVVDASESDTNLLIGNGHAIAVAEDVKKPENKAVKKKSIFSRKKKKQRSLMITNLNDWYKLAKAHPKVSIGIAVAVIIILSIIFQ